MTKHRGDRTVDLSIACRRGRLGKERDRRRVDLPLANLRQQPLAKMLEFDLVVWLTTEGIHRPEGARAAYSWAIYTALREHGIEVPLPQRDLHLKTAVPLRIDRGGTSRTTNHAGPEYRDRQAAQQKISAEPSSLGKESHGTSA